ncbi:MAG: redox-sensitive bicupin YhaK (pirin superfamily) [Candidatus Azotimanducaceae bacterium]|jgi:redox-sensitive bicupin YhaK (pirin superfamily)
MEYIRRSDERGAENIGWLDSKHSFSFGHYHDPSHMGISALRVINDDTVAAGGGFDTHGHQDMEIITYVTEGALEHKDTLGNEFVVEAGEVQRMTAGTGIMHSEYNHSNQVPVKFFQIWIQPNELGLTPSYQQVRIEQTGSLTPLVTPTGEAGSLNVHQAVSLSRLKLPAEGRQELETHRTGYLHIVSGKAEINGKSFSAGDAIGSNNTALKIVATEALEALWFDLP